MSKPAVFLYDTTLRDGTQAEGVSLTVQDKLKILQKLDDLGVHYVEGGHPGSNPTDAEFFKKAARLRLKSARLASFGSTRKVHVQAHKDSNLKALLSAGTPVVTIVGKSWDFHVIHALKTTLSENLKMVSSSVSFLKKAGVEVVYDAEHFFDGYKKNPDYALKTVQAAQEAGADWVVLCDTNGGTLPDEAAVIVRRVRKTSNCRLGIHAHNDAGVAVANSLTAVKEGCTQVQGTINGIGERCGNTNLCTLIPNLKLKAGVSCISETALKKLTSVSRFVSEVANISHDERQPYVGNSAFAHKGGMHVSAVMVKPETYEHTKPEQVGNHTRVLISGLSGQSNVLWKAAKYGIDLKSKTPESREILQQLKTLEHQGYQFEAAEGSFELLMKKLLKKYQHPFELEGFRIIVEKRKDAPPYSEATILIRVGKTRAHTAAEGDGPVNALDHALRKALNQFYPEIKNIRLLDYKVRVLNTTEGTAAKVRVLIESGDKTSQWGTVGVSENIIEASWHALVDSIVYGLLKRKGLRGQGVKQQKKQETRFRGFKGSSK